MALLVISSVCWAEEGASVDEACSKKLTESDPHMSAYVGLKYSTVGEHSSDKAYNYFVGVCVDALDDQPGCAVVQMSNDSTHCIGKTSQTQIARTADGAWIELTYTGGDEYGSHCGKTPRTARLAFLCDPFIKGQGDLDFLEENREDVICYYLFSIVSSAVCGVVVQTSAFQIVLIIVASLLGLWLLLMVVGFLYKRFIAGAKGWEQVPFLEGYKKCGNLMADGCDFVCRSRPKPSYSYKDQAFGGEEDSDEEERDDNLLPM